MGTDILALQVRQCAGKGGNTYLASASKLFCELSKTDPEAVKALFKSNWPIQMLAYTLLFLQTFSRSLIVVNDLKLTNYASTLGQAKPPATFSRPLCNTTTESS